MRVLSRLLISLILTFSSNLLAVDGPTEIRPDFQIPKDGVLKRETDFWMPIYSQYTGKDGVIHDAKYLIVYEIIDLSDSKKPKKRQIKEAKDCVRKILLKLHRSGVQDDPSLLDQLSVEEKLVYDLYKNVNEPNKFLAAAHFKRLRFQLGQKDQMDHGLRESGRYLPFMEEIFIKAGMPFELTRLPFVESSFNTHARSKVGASGIWQFMRSTGKNFLKINAAVDERNDPLRATEAAAQLLKINYESLGTWPLAVTAYNHGRAGLLRAVNRLGTKDLPEVIEKNKARSFGFASSNFFSCLMSVLEIERHSEKYFPGLERDKPQFFYEVTLPDSILFRDLISFMHLDRGRVLDLNPAITTDGVQSRVRIPRNYRLRLPNPDGNGTPDDLASKERVFLAGFEKIPKRYRIH